MATIRELLLGTKFIPEWKANHNTGRFCLDRQPWLKRHFVAKGSYDEVDKLFWQLRNGIFEMLEFYDPIGHCSPLEFQRKTCI